MEFIKGDLDKYTLMYNHSGFLCHMTFYMQLRHFSGNIYPLFNSFCL